MNQAKWRSFSKEELEEIVKNSKSTREVARKLGYSLNGGGTMQSLKRMYEELNLDTFHFTGQAWNKENYDYDGFKEGNVKKNGKTIATPLIKLRGQKCENCGITEWLGQPINLEVHHIDGDRTNNSLENLQLLCPNCHSYTTNFRKPKNKTIIPEEQFVQALNENVSIRQALIRLGLSACGKNYDRAYALIEKYNIKHLKNKS